MRSQGPMFQEKICHTNMSSKSDRFQVCVFHVRALESIIYLYNEPTNAHVYVQSYTIIFTKMFQSLL